jgi:hypothetical protein
MGLLTIILVFLFLYIEWLGRDHQHGIANLGTNWRRPLRWAMYYGIGYAIFIFAGAPQQFIYFQF